jgi:hypothetical protein
MYNINLKLNNVITYSSWFSVLGFCADGQMVRELLRSEDSYTACNCKYVTDYYYYYYYYPSGTKLYLQHGFCLC